MLDVLSFFKKQIKEEESDSSEDERQPVLTQYRSADVAIPPDFLSVANPPADARPATVKVIDFADTALPEYKGLYAVVLDHVLSPSECEALLRLAEASVPREDWRRKKGKKGAQKNHPDDDNVASGSSSAVDPAGPEVGAAEGTPSSTGATVAAAETQREEGAVSGDPWRPALVNVGGGYERLFKDYRNSDRIIWDHQDLVDRLWARCASAPGIQEQLAVVEGDSDVLGGSTTRKGQRWEFRRLNKRMRFLKYQGGQFFRPHCDGAYYEPTEDGTHLETLFTVHLYLNDAKKEAEPGDADKTDLVGGATTFLSSNEQRRLDVDPKAGRVLIFQHRRLYHSGDDVSAGTKYTMRTDMIFEKVKDVARA